MVENARRWVSLGPGDGTKVGYSPREEERRKPFSNGDGPAVKKLQIARVNRICARQKLVRADVNCLAV